MHAKFDCDSWAAISIICLRGHAMLQQHILSSGAMLVKGQNNNKTILVTQIISWEQKKGLVPDDIPPTLKNNPEEQDIVKHL